MISKSVAEKIIYFKPRKSNDLIPWLCICWFGLSTEFPVAEIKKQLTMDGLLETLPVILCDIRDVFQSTIATTNKEIKQ